MHHIYLLSTWNSVREECGYSVRPALPYTIYINIKRELRQELFYKII